MTAKTYNINQPEAPKLLADEFDIALPAIGQPLTDGVSVEGSDRLAYLNIHFSSGASSTLTLTRTIGATTVSELLNGGANIPADAMHVETVPVVGGELINLTYGATSDTYTCRIGAVVQNG
jgi:hypothetical protein